MSNYLDSFSEWELDRYRSQFNQFDTAGSGFIPFKVAKKFLFDNSLT